MFIVENYSLAILFCFITMLCWGSWANTQKLTSGKWRFELFYWDYVLGILILSLIAALTLGSFGNAGRSFADDLQQASLSNIGSAFLGGIVFNLANILLTAAIAIAGMSVAFPIGIGLALILGVLINYWAVQKGAPIPLFSGVFLITLAIVLNAIAYKKNTTDTGNRPAVKGILLSIIAGILMSFFYRFIAASMDVENFVAPMPEKMTPYSAFFVFALGIFISNFIFNTVLMKRPLEGAPINYATYFKGRFNLHIVGVLGGIIWGIGNILNLVAAGKAGPAISYGLGQGATLVAAIWGVAVWKEFKGSSRIVTFLLLAMFALFIIGLGLVIIAGH